MSQEHPTPTNNSQLQSTTPPQHPLNNQHPNPKDPSLHDSKPDNTFIGNTTLTDLEKLKTDIENLKEYYKVSTEKQKSKDPKIFEDSEIMQQKLKDQKSKQISSKTLKEPIIKQSNFDRYIKSELKPKDLNKINLNIFSYKNLQQIITYCGSYPENARKFIWKYLLSLPNDKYLFSKYSHKGVHPFYENLQQVFPIADQKYFRRVQAICSLISFWCPHVGNIYYLPNIVFPFVKTILGDDLFIFETLIALFNSVFKYWFDHYPNMPYEHIDYIVDIINKETNDQMKHQFENTNTNSIKINELIWRLLTNFFSESFNKNDWLSFVDFILSYNHKPEMILYFSGAFILQYKDDLIMHKDNKIKISKVLYDITLPRNVLTLIKSTLKLYGKYYKTQKMVYYAYVPFPDNEYPIMDKFPLDFLKTTQQLKDEIKSGKLDINEEVEYSDKKKKILDKKYNELLQREKDIEFAYQELLATQKEKNEILKRELDAILYKKEMVYNEIKRHKNKK